MDLKTALKDILPKLRLKSKRSSDKWIIDRPIEFHECPCGEMVDQRIIEVIIITCPNEYNVGLRKRLSSFHEIHNDHSVIEHCMKASPCPRCYRWAVIHKKSGRCHMCNSNPWTVMPVPAIAKRSWYVESGTK